MTDRDRESSQESAVDIPVVKPQERRRSFLQDAAEKEVKEEEDVVLEEISAPPIPAEHKKKGKQAENKPCMITRSGRVVKVVNEDNTHIRVLTDYPVECFLSYC